AVALQVVADPVVDHAQLPVELGPGGGGGTHADDPVDAHAPADHAHVAGRQHEHAGAVANRTLAHPDRPARLGDAIAGADRVLDHAAAGIDVEHALADAQLVGDVGHPLHQLDETAVDLAHVA